MTSTFSPTPLVLAEALTLISWWKALLILVPFIPWGLAVSKVLDKHAERWHLEREKWGAMHLTFGLVALIAAVSMPFKGEGAFYAGLAAAIVLLVANIIVYAVNVNKDERVPEAHRITMNTFFKSGPKKEKKDKNANVKIELVIKSPDKSVVPIPAAETPELAIRLAAESLFARALTARGSQLEILPSGKEGTYVSRWMVDGMANQGDPMPAAEAFKLMDFWKAAAKLDVADRRKKLVGDIVTERFDVKRKVRVSSIGGPGGMKLALLFDPDKAVQRKPENLGMLDAQLTELRNLVADGKGVVLLSSPPDMGRSSTFYTIMKMHDAYTTNVQTVEIDIQDSPDGIRQNKWDPNVEGPEYSTLVRSILRRDPAVLGLAECPDANTAKEASKAEVDRVRVYVCLPADGAMQALQLWTKLVGDPDAASKCLHGVISQKLFRKLCNNCRVGYQPSPDMVKKLGLPTDKIKQLFKKGGQVMVKDKPETCPVCAGVGYMGQEGAFEIYPIGPAEQALIKATDWNGLKLEFRKKNLPNVQQSALRKALDGTTSVEEVMRITTDAAAAAAAPKPAAPAAPAAKAPPAKA